MTLTEIGRPQISVRCPYKVVISPWVPTRPEAKTRNDQNDQKWMKRSPNVTQVTTPVVYKLCF